VMKDEVGSFMDRFGKGRVPGDEARWYGEVRME
jgi:hypothetical protein